MNEINIKIDLFKGKRVLITPLNWGLGHATRCIPIIRLLTENNVVVGIASDGEALLLLKKEFPNLQSFELPSYNIKYPFRWIELNIMLQAHKFIRAIFKERSIINSIVLEWNPDVIISDNRFGCRSNDCESIFMTHQINLLGSSKISQIIGQKINRWLINKFDKLWIPDFDGSKGLAGRLSKMNEWEKSHLYINPLSRFEHFNLKFQQDVIVVLSGPEPERTRLEKQLIDLLSKLEYTVLFVRGTMSINPLTVKNQNINIIDFMESESLNKSMIASKLVICRSGYSSIMDLNRIKKKAILIPTPGQTEQEYLADYHSNSHMFSVWRVKEPVKRLVDVICDGLKSE